MSNFVLRKKFWIILNLISLALFVFIANKNRITNPRPLLKDSGEYVSLSYHLAFNQIFSYDGKTPTNFREPLNSCLNAINIRLFTNIEESIPVEKLATSLNMVTQLTQINIFFLILLFVGIWWGVFILINSHVWVIPAAFLPMTYFSIDTTYLKSLNSDLPSIVILIFSISLILSLYKRPSLWKSLVLAFLLGLLIFSKGVFYYLVPVYIVFVTLLIWFFDKENDKFFRVKFLILSLFISMLMILPWQIRNYYQLNDFSLTKRGGTILLIRAEMNQMTEEERNGMYYFFAPDILKEIFFEKYLGYKESDYLDGGKLQRLNRDLINDYQAIEAENFDQCISFLRRTMYVSIPKLQDEAKEMNVDSDEYIKKTALGRIKNDWYSHLKVSVPMAWKGLWFYKGNHLSFVLLLILSYFSFAYLFINSIIRLNIQFLIFLGLPVLIFLFHTLLTHNISRYILPIIPFTSMCFVLVIEKFFIVLMRNANPKHKVV